MLLLWRNTGNTAQQGPEPCPLQTPSSVGFQANSKDDVTTQTKPLGCHQPDIGIVIPTLNRSWGKPYQATPIQILTSSLV